MAVENSQRLGLRSFKFAPTDQAPSPCILPKARAMIVGFLLPKTLLTGSTHTPLAGKLESRLSTPRTLEAGYSLSPRKALLGWCLRHIGT